MNKIDTDSPYISLKKFFKIVVEVVNIIKALHGIKINTAKAMGYDNLKSKWVVVKEEGIIY